MRYFVTIAGRTLEVELRGDAVLVDGDPLSLDVAAVPGTTLRHLLAGGASVLLAAQRGSDAGSWELQLDGVRYEVDVEDERTRAIRSRVGAAEGARGPRPVKAPMPGLVVRVEVAPGEQVAAGQGVVIVEAMKMQNELKADGPGVVRKIHVQAGTAVEKGVTLVEFDELPAEGA
jgi:biotin carboxyl carrier protein